MTIQGNEAAAMLRQAAEAARNAARVLALSGCAQRNAALAAIAQKLRTHGSEILAANEADLAEAQDDNAFRDRLALSPERIEVMAAGVETVAALPDPLGRVLAEWRRPNGLRIRRLSCPIGVIGMIYESRPNVGADAAALCLKSGNAVILRGGAESFRSAGAINAAVAEGLIVAGLPPASVQNAPTSDRAFIAAMLAAAGQLDLIIPRGGKGLVARVAKEARVPVLAHAEGLCHTYVHRAADPAMARRIVANAKMRRPGICGATETLLIDAAVAPALLPLIVSDLRAMGCDFRADPAARVVMPELAAAQPDDFDTEWLDKVLSVKVVAGIEEAVSHIVAHGSLHTEAIITEDEAAAGRFLAEVNSAVTMWNASTQFCDGAEFGFGAEIGIATGRTHARGPIGLEQLTTFRYQVLGQGQVRP